MRITQADLDVLHDISKDMLDFIQEQIAARFATRPETHDALFLVMMELLRQKIGICHEAVVRHLTMPHGPTDE